MPYHRDVNWEIESGMAPGMPSFATLKLLRPVSAVRPDGNDPDAKLLLLTSNALHTVHEDTHTHHSAESVQRQFDTANTHPRSPLSTSTPLSVVNPGLTFPHPPPIPTAAAAYVSCVIPDNDVGNGPLSPSWFRFKSTKFGKPKIDDGIVPGM